MTDTTRCVIEDVLIDVLLIGNFSVSPKGRSVNFNLTDPIGNELIYRINVDKASFAITSQHGGDHRLCFTNFFTSEEDEKYDQYSTIIDFSLKHGPAAVSFANEKETSHGTETKITSSIKTLSDMSKEVNHEIITLREIAEQDNVMSKKTLASVSWLSIISILFTIVLGIVEVIYLKRFFTEQKVA
ncbi:putative p24 family protein delta-1 [Monocercomonoides exilis]|uniref:putative p24 family protein delta-1 n=1 Tax=Monocercomonoides exilis TaxID=2049356 RepID=UPI00355956C1|nr:putative p24 family protein delta-1 [Monocercomonoides exilis]